MATKPLPSPEVLRQLLRYEPDTGKLFWRDRPLCMFPDARAWRSWNTRYAGKEAFTASNLNGYRHGNIFGRLHRAHRVIWAMETGSWPKKMIDHIDGDRARNCFSNLREATASSNQHNKKTQANNTSGFKGASWDKRCKKWQATIKSRGKQKHLGHFDSPEAAHAAYCEAAQGLHGEFARTS